MYPAEEDDNLSNLPYAIAVNMLIYTVMFILKKT